MSKTGIGIALPKQHARKPILELDKKNICSKMQLDSGDRPGSDPAPAVSVLVDHRFTVPKRGR